MQNDVLLALQNAVLHLGYARWFLNNTNDVDRVARCIDDVEENLGDILRQLEHTVLVKPCSAEVGHGVKYLYVREVCASATTWEEALTRLRNAYAEENAKAETGEFYVSGGRGE